MSNIFDITKFDLYKEDNRREVKKSNGGLPSSLWDTYSAFANCYGGVIILGVAENKDGSWRTTGLKAENQGKLLKEFWDTINNRKKVNINLLTDTDVETFKLNDDMIIVIYVPMLAVNKNRFILMMIFLMELFAEITKEIITVPNSR